MTHLALIASIAILVQAIYWHFIFQKAARPSTLPSGSSNGTRPFLSVVVCFHQPQARIPQVIKSIAGQSYKDFELVLVNDGPVATEDIPWIEDLSSESFLKYISHTKILPGKKEALFAAIQASRGPWIVVTDIDCQPGPEWLLTLSEHIMNHFSSPPLDQNSEASDQPGVILGFSPYAFRPGLLNFIIRQETLLTAFQYLGWAQTGHAYMGVGRNMVSHQSIYFRYPLATHIHIPTGDDDLFVNQAAQEYPVAICNDVRSFVLSQPKESWKDWIKQKMRHNSGGKYYSISSKIRLAVFTSALMVEKGIMVWILFTRIDLFLALILLKTGTTIIPLKNLYRTFDQGRRFWQMWIYEWIHVIYLVIVSPYALFLNKKRWD